MALARVLRRRMIVFTQTLIMPSSAVLLPRARGRVDSGRLRDDSAPAGGAADMAAGHGWWQRLGGPTALLIGTAALCVAALLSCRALPHAAPTPAVKPPAPAAPFTLSGGAPTSFVQSTSDTRMTQVIPVREGLPKPALFHAATEVLTQRFTVDVSDPHAGFLMTPWQATLLRNGVPDLRYRSRIVVRFLGDEWRDVAVRAEANWQHGDEWTVGYDSTLLRTVSEDMIAKIGKLDPTKTEAKKPAP